MDERIRDILSKLENVKPAGEGHVACCPCHDDSEPSMSIGVGDDGRILLNCFAGCPTTLIVQALGLRMRDLMPERRRRGKRRNERIVAVYDYRDEDGVLLYQSERRVNEDTGEKTFRQRRIDDDGRPIYSMKGVRRVLYRLPETLAAMQKNPDAGIVICEGEKDVDRLREAGFIATCNSGGSSVWNKSFGETFRGRDVVVIEDNDDPGRKWCAKVEASLDGVAARVGRVMFRDEAEKFDVSDWLDAGHTTDELRDLLQASLETADERPPDPVPPDRTAGTEYEKQVCEAVGIDVLGFVDDRAKVYSEFHHRTEVISPDRLTFAGILRLCGPRAKEVVVRGDDAGPDQYTVSKVRNAIALLSGFRKADEDSEVGPGCWRGVDEDGDTEDSVVLVGSGESAVLNGQPDLERFTKPRRGGLILDTSSPLPWFDANELGQNIANASDPNWCRDVIAEAERLFAGWVWSDGNAPQIVTGCVLATWVQALWDWRPQIVVTGESKSGKTYLFMSLERLFGPLAIKSSQSSAAGIRQRLRRSASVVLCDEIDSTRERQQIREMVRASSRGDIVLRGTASQRGTDFTLRHIFWLAGITLDLKRAPDRNRFVLLELIPPAAEDRGKLAMITQDAAWTLGQKLLAIAVRHVFRARDTASANRTLHIDGVDDRLVECYSVPAAMISAALNDSEPASRARLETFCSGLVDDEETKDSDELLADLLAARVPVGGGDWRSLEQCLFEVPFGEGDSPFREVLQSFGIAKAHDTELGDQLFIVPRSVAPLLKDKPEWADQDLGAILARVEGAFRDRRRLTGRNARGVTIPWEAVKR